MKPPSESGGTREGTAACMNPSRSKPDALGDGVNAVQLGRWLDDAILMSRNAGSDPAEHQRLGIWLARIRRALP